MKTFRLIGMALVAVLMCLSFTSCDKDDNPENNENDTNQKKLVKLVITEEENGKTNGGMMYAFTYDSKGRVVSISMTEGINSSTQYTYTESYTWNGNTIVEKYKDNTTTYTLNTDGMVIKSAYSSGDDVFTYNSLNHLNTIQDDDETRTLSWDKDKLTEVVTQGYDGNYKNIYSYSGKTCNGYSIPLAVMIYDMQYSSLPLVHPELFGCRSTQLPDEILSKDYDDDDSGKITYTFDKDNYVETIIVTYSEGYIYKYTCTWEEQ